MPAGQVANLYATIGVDAGSFQRGMSQVDSRMAETARTIEQHGRGISGVFGGIGGAVGGMIGGLSRIGLAGMGISALAGAARGLGEALGVGLNIEIEDVRAQIMAFTKDAKLTEQVLATVRKEADKTPFSFREIAAATAGLMPAARQANEPLMDLVKTAEILAASNPAQGLEGAAFALREAVSGDFMSVITRFNLPRSYITQLKQEGVPALEAVRRAMTAMGFDADLVANKAGTLRGRWSTFMDTIDGVRAKINQPIFDRLGAGLEQAQRWFDENKETVNLWAARIAAAFGLVLDGVGALASGFASGLGNVLSTITRIGQAIWEALSWLNPFATHSPSLVSQVQSGTTLIQSSFRGMASVTTDLSSVSAAIHNFISAAGNIRDAVKPAEQTVRALRDTLGQARDQFNALNNIQLLGTKAFSDRAFDLDQQIAALQKRINDLKLAGADENALKGLNDQMEKLRLQADNVRLEEKLQLDPQRRKIEEVRKPTQELSYLDLIFQTGRWRGEIERLTPAVDVAEAAVEQMKEQVEGLDAAMRGTGKGGPGLTKDGKSPADQFEEDADNFWKRMEAERIKLLAMWNSFRADIETAFAPITNIWTRIAAAWQGSKANKAPGGRFVEGALGLDEFKAGGIGGVLQELGGIAGEIGRWLGEQWAKIDWVAVWRNAHTLGASIAEGVGPIWGSVTAWLREQWGKVDWDEITRAQKDADAAVARWIKTWEAKESGAATADWLIAVMREGIKGGGKSLGERAGDLIRWFPQNMIQDMFSTETAMTAYGKIAEWLAGLFTRAIERLREHWRGLWGNLPGADQMPGGGGIQIPAPGGAAVPLSLPVYGMPGGRIGPAAPTSSPQSTVILNIDLPDAETVSVMLSGDPAAVDRLARAVQRHEQLQGERY